MDEANNSHLKYAASPTEHVLHGPVNSVKLALKRMNTVISFQKCMFHCFFHCFG